MSLLTVTDFPAVRASLQVEVPAALLPSEVINYPQNLPMAMLRIREAIPKLKGLTQSSTIMDAVRAITGGVDNEDVKLKLKTAIIRRTAAHILPHVRQRIQTDAGEYSERFAKVDWEREEQRLIDESSKLVEELKGADSEVVVPRIFVIGGARG